MQCIARHASGRCACTAIVVVLAVDKLGGQLAAAQACHPLYNV